MTKYVNQTGLNGADPATGALVQAAASGTLAYSTATYPSTTTGNKLLYSSSANVVAEFGGTARGTLVTNNSGVPSILQIPDGNILIGNPASAPAAAAISTIFNGSIASGNGAIDIAANNFHGVNLLINGNFSVWQRGAGGAAAIAVPASTTAYTADRWQLATGANQACTVTQVAGSPQYSPFKCRVQRNAGQTGTDTLRFCQTVPVSRSYNCASKDLTFRITLDKGADYSGGQIHVNLYTGTGTDKSGIGGSFVGNVTKTVNQTIPGGTNNIFVFGPFFAASSYAMGSTVTQVAIELAWEPSGTAGTNDWINFSLSALEVCTIAAFGAGNGVPYSITNSNTPCWLQDFNETLRECQPYYWKSFPYGTAPAQNSGTYNGAIVYTPQISGLTAGFTDMVYLPQPMRVRTAPTFYSPSSATAKWYNATLAADSGTAAATYYEANNFAVNNPQVVGDLVGNVIAVHATIDADLT